jgi:uncharacterized phage protein (TIGR01671 family)
MRELKFRAWFKAGLPFGQQYTGMYSVIDLDKESVTVKRSSTFAQSIFIKSAVEIMQYTGLKDKNGKEIYEGDILQDRQGKGEVKWIQEHCSFLVRVRKPHGYHKLEGDYQLNLTEVIGNIYENPELLKQEV